MAVWPKGRWAKFVVPMAIGLVGLSAIFTFRSTPARILAFLGTIAGLYVQMLVGRRMSQVDEQEQRVRQLRAHLDPPKFVRPKRQPWRTLTDPLYGIAPFYGRTQDLRALDRFLGGSNSIGLLSGPAWCGKTRLMSEWASTLSDPWISGWVRTGEGRSCIKHAVEADVPVLLMLRGWTSDVEEVLETIPAQDSRIRVLIELPRVGTASELAGRISDRAKLLLNLAWVREIGHAGRETDYRRWFPNLVRSYGRSLQKPTMGLDSISGSLGPSIGFLNVVAVATLVGQRKLSVAPVLNKVAGDLWESYLYSWSSSRENSKWGVAHFSDKEVQIAVATAWLVGHQGLDGVLSELLDLKDNQTQVENLHAWMSEVVGLGQVGDRTSTLVAASAVSTWSKRKQRELASGVRRAGREPTSALLEAVMTAAEIVPGLRSLIVDAIGSDAGDLGIAIDLALKTRVFSRDVDEALSQAIEKTKPGSKAIDTLLSQVDCHSLPIARIAALSRKILLLRREMASPEGSRPVDQRTLAQALEELGDCFFALGNPRSALSPTEEAASIYRRLGDKTALAHALTSLARVMYDAGGQEDRAVSAARESVAIYRELANPTAVEPVTFDPELAEALDVLASCQSEVGDLDGAVATSREVVQIYRGLLDRGLKKPEECEAELAKSLHNLGTSLVKSRGVDQEALSATWQAVEIYERLAVDDHLAARPYIEPLAMSLHSLASSIAQTGGPWAEALWAAETSVHLLEDLAIGNPAAFEPMLGSALYELSCQYEDSGGRRQDALLAARRSAMLFRRLIKQEGGNRRAHAAGLALALESLARQLSAMGRHKVAIARSKESIAISRRLARPSAPYHALSEPGLASGLMNHAGVLWEAGGHQREAVARMEESIAVYRRLLASGLKRPSAHQPGLATALLNLAGFLSEYPGRESEALSAAKEARSVFAHLADPETGMPAAYESKLEACDQLMRSLFESEGVPFGDG